MNIFLVPGIVLETLFRLGCPEIFFFSFSLKLKCWDILRHIIASQGSLKRKGDHSSQFILQVITSSGEVLPCNYSINLYVYCFCLMYSIQKQKLNIKIELILTV